MPATITETSGGVFTFTPSPDEAFRCGEQAAAEWEAGGHDIRSPDTARFAAYHFRDRLQAFTSATSRPLVHQFVEGFDSVAHVQRPEPDDAGPAMRYAMFYPQPARRRLWVCIAAGLIVLAAGVWAWMRFSA